MPHFIVKYARVVTMQTRIEADSPEDALKKATEMEVSGKLPSVYKVPSDLPEHVLEISDYDPIWEAEPEGRDG